MLFCRTVLLSLIGSVWCATTPVPQGHWLRGRTRDISKTVQPDDYPRPTRVLRGEVENSTAWIGALSNGDGTKTDDIAFETNTDDMLPPPTTLSWTQGISKTVPSDDHHTSVLGGEDLEVNSTAWNGASSDSDGTKTDDMASETNTDEIVPSEKHTTTLFRTEDEFRTRRGIVLVDDDFNVSPEPGVNQGWGDGAVKSTKTSSTIDEGSGQEEPPSPPTPAQPDLDGSGDGDSTAEPWTNSCLNSTCDSRDMFVYPGHDEIVPVGTNLTLSCVQSNESVVELRWYKYDGDGNQLLQNTNSESELAFAIHKSRTEDSGRYVCLRGSAGSCCHRTLHVKVYEVPNYRYHLIVIGVVAAVSLFACLLIGVCRNYKTKKYEVQLELQNMESDCVYKM